MRNVLSVLLLYSIPFQNDDGTSEQLMQGTFLSQVVKKLLRLALWSFSKPRALIGSGNDPILISPNMYGDNCSKYP